MPTLPQLLRFPGTRNGYIDLIQRIGSNYFTFGIFLLDDLTGARINALETSNLSNPNRINLAIFREWLQGSGVQPVTWRTLVKALREAQLSTLADEIETTVTSERGRQTEAEKTQQERKWLQGPGAGSSVPAAHGATAVPSTLTTSQEKLQSSAPSSDDRGGVSAEGGASVSTASATGHSLSDCLSRLSGPFSAAYAWNLSRLKPFKSDGTKLDGTGTVIAILDTLVNKNHEVFRGCNVTNYPDIDVTKCASVVHGSVCAAVAVGKRTTTFPGGVAPGASLIVLQIADGNPPSANRLAVLNALDCIISRDDLKIDVVSISYDLAEEMFEEVDERIQKLVEKGIVVVAAAGNRGGYQDKLCIPARCRNVISVGSLDEVGKLLDLNPDCEIDVFAPGENITIYDGEFMGSSFAAPAIAGIVSLLKQCAKKFEAQTGEDILNVDVLKEIFKHYSNNDNKVFRPLDFLNRVADSPDPLVLKKIICEIKKLEGEQMEQ